jgi:hypothetical protein
MSCNHTTRESYAITGTLQWEKTDNYVPNRHTIHTDGLSLDNVLMPCMPLVPPDTNMPLKFKIEQFTLHLAFSMVIKKLQGQTLDKI